MGTAELAWDILQKSGYLTKWGVSPCRDRFLDSWSGRAFSDDGHILVAGSATVATTRVDAQTWMIHNLGRDRDTGRRRDVLDVMRAALGIIQVSETQNFVLYYEKGAVHSSRWLQSFADAGPPGLVAADVQLYRRDTSRLEHGLTHNLGTLAANDDGFIVRDRRGSLLGQAWCRLGRPDENLFGLLDMVQCCSMLPETTAQLLQAAIGYYADSGRDSMMLEQVGGLPWTPDIERAGFKFVATGTKWLGNAETLKAWQEHLAKVHTT